MNHKNNFGLVFKMTAEKEGERRWRGGEPGGGHEVTLADRTENRFQIWRGISF